MGPKLYITGNTEDGLEWISQLLLGRPYEELNKWQRAAQAVQQTLGGVSSRDWIPRDGWEHAPNIIRTYKESMPNWQWPEVVVSLERGQALLLGQMVPERVIAIFQPVDWKLEEAQGIRGQIDRHLLKTQYFATVGLLVDAIGACGLEHRLLYWPRLKTDERYAWEALKEISSMGRTEFMRMHIKLSSWISGQ